MAFRPRHSHVNYCNQLDLEHQFTLIFLISTWNIQRKIKILPRKPEIGKILQNLSKTPILLLNLWSCINKNTIIGVGKKEQKKSIKFKFLLQAKFKYLLFVTSVSFKSLTVE